MLRIFSTSVTVYEMVVVGASMRMAVEWDMHSWEASALNPIKYWMLGIFITSVTVYKMVVVSASMRDCS